MTVGLFIPCYIDQFYPNVGRATLGLLERLGCQVHFPLNQTCCGQPMANAGHAELTGACNRHFIDLFHSYDYIVAPSGSCVLHLKEHLSDNRRPQDADAVRNKLYELTAFLTDVLDIRQLPARFPYRVGLHISCHGQRMLNLASMSERVVPFFSKAETLLSMVQDLQLVKTARVDECCGFGGTFCVTEPDVSVAMGANRIAEHENNEVQFITGGDTSCLMHLEGILKRKNSPVKIIHLAEILNAHEDLQ